MCFVSKYGISNIVVMWNLYFIEQDNIFKFCRIADYSSLSYNCIAADKCTVTNLCIFSDNCRSVDICRFKYFCRFCNPNIFSYFIILVCRKCLSQFYNEITNLRKHFPRISHSFKDILCDCLVEIIHLCYCHFFEHF